MHTTITRNTGGDGNGLHIGSGSNAILTNTILVSHTVGINVDFDASASLESTLWGNR